MSVLLSEADQVVPSSANGESMYLFREDEAAQQPRSMLRADGVEYAVKDELREQQFVTSADLACDAALHVCDVGCVREPEPPEDTFSTLELPHLQNVVRSRYLFLE